MKPMYLWLVTVEICLPQWRHGSVLDKSHLELKLDYFLHYLNSNLPEWFIFRCQFYDEVMDVVLTI